MIVRSVKERIMNDNNGRCPDGQDLHKEFMLFRNRVNDGWKFDRPQMISAWTKFKAHADGCKQCGIEKEE